jgi:hypothetical protein
VTDFIAAAREVMGNEFKAQDVMRRNVSDQRLFSIRATRAKVKLLVEYVTVTCINEAVSRACIVTERCPRRRFLHAFRAREPGQP